MDRPGEWFGVPIGAIVAQSQLTPTYYRPMTPAELEAGRLQQAAEEEARRQAGALEVERAREDGQLSVLRGQLALSSITDGVERLIVGFASYAPVLDTSSSTYLQRYVAGQVLAAELPQLLHDTREINYRPEPRLIGRETLDDIGMIKWFVEHVAAAPTMWIGGIGDATYPKVRAVAGWRVDEFVIARNGHTMYDPRWAGKVREGKRLRGRTAQDPSRLTPERPRFWITEVAAMASVAGLELIPVLH